MTICILKHLKNRYSQFTWNELTSLKCFFPQFIDLILAGFILTNPISSRDYFLNETLLQRKKKGQNQDEATALSCHMLATGLHLLSREQRKPRGERAWTILAINVTIDINECKHRGYSGGKEKIDVRPSGQIIFPRIHHKIYFLLCILIIWNNARNFLYLVFKGRRTVGLKGGRLGIKISLYSYSGLICDFLFPHFPC